MIKENRQKIRKCPERMLKDFYECTTIPLSLHDISTKEILLRRYRILSCIKLLHIYGMSKVTEISIPDISDAFGIIPFSEMEDEYADFEEHMIQDSQLGDMGREFLTAVLQDTGWKVLYLEEIESYEELDPELLEKIKKSVSIHLGLICGYSRSVDTHNAAEAFTKKTGIAADSETLLYYFVPEMNVVLLNEQKEEMLRICQNNEKCKEWEEYKELTEITPIYLFDAFFEQYSAHTALSLEQTEEKETWQYFNYMLGEGIYLQTETVGFSNLCYESVIHLHMADTIAKEFLIRYRAERGKK